MIVRGPLALHFHMLKDNSTLHDIDGKAVDRFQDRKVEELYNDCLDAYYDCDVADHSAQECPGARHEVPA